MKKNFTVLATLVALVLGLSFTSCDKEEDLYGWWQLVSTTSGVAVDGSDYIYFSEDGKYYEATKWSYDDSYSVSLSCDFKFKRGYLTIKTGWVLDLDYEAEIDGDELTIGWSNYTSTYKRCEAPAGLMKAINEGATISL